MLELLKNWINLLPFIIWSDISEKSLLNEGWIQKTNHNIWVLDDFRIVYGDTSCIVSYDGNGNTYLFTVNNRYDLYKLIQSIVNNSK